MAEAKDLKLNEHFTAEDLYACLAPKICLVCGDQALSCNFGAVTCESCKAFFRRNADKADKLKNKCLGTCEIKFENRSRCKKCRLDKCFQQGMKKELILNAEQKMKRKRKIEINKLKKTILDKDFSKTGKAMPQSGLNITDSMIEKMAKISPEKKSSSAPCPNVETDTRGKSFHQDFIQFMSARGLDAMLGTKIKEEKPSDYSDCCQLSLANNSNKGYDMAEVSNTQMDQSSKNLQDVEMDINNVRISGNDSGGSSSGDSFDLAGCKNMNEAACNLLGDDYEHNKLEMNIKKEDNIPESGFNGDDNIEYSESILQEHDSYLAVPMDEMLAKTGPLSVNSSSSSSGVYTIASFDSSLTDASSPGSILNSACSSPAQMIGDGKQGSDYNTMMNDDADDDDDDFVPVFNCPLFGDCVSEYELYQMNPEMREIFKNAIAATAGVFDQPVRKPLMDHLPTYTAWVNQLDVSVEILVNLSKQLPSYTDFCQEDQVALLKGSFLDNICAQSLRAFDAKNKKRFVLPKCNIPMSGEEAPYSFTSINFLLQTGNGLRLYKSYIEFYENFSQASGGELSLLMCVMLILLHTPRENVSYKNYEKVKYWYDFYNEAMKSLIRIKYPNNEEVTIKGMFQALDRLQKCSNLFQIVLLQSNICELEPLLAEVFDVRV